MINSINFTGQNIQKGIDKLSKAAINICSNSNSKLTPLEKDVFQKTTSQSSISEKTLQEAKDFVIKSIKAASPTESAAYIKNDKIIETALGDATTCDLSDRLRVLLENPKNAFSCVHSHPKLENGMTNSLSMADYKLLDNYGGLKSIYAVNTEGEHCLLEKIAEPTDKLNSAQLNNLYEDGLLDFIKNTNEKEYNRFNELQNKITSAFNGKTTITPQEIMEIMSETTKIREENLAKYTHHFWQENAPKLGLNYESTFSCFK